MAYGPDLPCKANLPAHHLEGSPEGASAARARPWSSRQPSPRQHSAILKPSNALRHNSSAQLGSHRPGKVIAPLRAPRPGWPPARLLVLNKADRLEAASARDSERVHPLSWWLERHPDALAVSALTGEGLDRLAEQVLERQKGAVRTLRGRFCGWLVRKGLMSSPPRRV